MTACSSSPPHWNVSSISYLTLLPQVRHFKGTSSLDSRFNKRHNVSVIAEDFYTGTKIHVNNPFCRFPDIGRHHIRSVKGSKQRMEGVISCTPPSSIQPVSFKIWDRSTVTWGSPPPPPPVPTSIERRPSEELEREEGARVVKPKWRPNRKWAGRTHCGTWWSTSGSFRQYKQRDISPDIDPPSTTAPSGGGGGAEAWPSFGLVWQIMDNAFHMWLLIP